MIARAGEDLEAEGAVCVAALRPAADGSALLEPAQFAADFAADPPKNRSEGSAR